MYVCMYVYICMYIYIHIYINSINFFVFRTKKCIGILFFTFVNKIKCV